MKNSLVRTFTSVCLSVLLVGAVSAVQNRYHHGHWPAPTDFAQSTLGLVLLSVVFAALVWLAFVPRSIEYDEDGILIEGRFGLARSLRWMDLYSYGTCRGTFTLRFENTQTIQFCPEGFKRADWKAFMDFLKREYPDERANMWGEPRGRQSR